MAAPQPKLRRFLLAALVALAALGALAPAGLAQGAMNPLPVAAPQLNQLPPTFRNPPDPKFNQCGVPRPVPGSDPAGVSPKAPNPLANQPWYVNTMREGAWDDFVRYRRTGQHGKANLVWKVAREPRFRWFGRWTRPNFRTKTKEYLWRAACAQPGSVPLILVMRHQGKECHKNYTAGGKAEDRRTRRWYDIFAETVGDARVVIAFEPDSLGTLECMKKSRRKSRLRNMRYGIDVFTRKMPNATIYIEAGASDWEKARRTARQLRYVGIHKVRGFMLNVTHYDWTSENIRHGLKISRLTGGKHFIISTALNGRGPKHKRIYVTKRKWFVRNEWCNPSKRGLGAAPTTNVRRPDKVDAYMWIGRPGESAGKCNGGPSPPGSWWPERALSLAKWATGKISPRG